MPKIKAIVLVTLSVACGLSAVGRSQPVMKAARGGQERREIITGKALIQVHAVVTDRAGRPVEGLLKEDFRIEEDGAAQNPNFFSMVKIAGKSDIPAAAWTGTIPEIPEDSLEPVAAPSSWVLVLLVDTIHISSNGLERVRETLNRFLEEHKTDSDLVAIMSTSGKPGGKGEFTADLGKLRESIKQIRPGHARFESFLTPALCGKVVRNDPQALTLAQVIIDSEDRAAGSVLMPVRGNPVAEASSKCMMLLLETASRRRAVMSAVGTAIDKMSALPGQHIIALFTEGFSMVAPGGEPAIADIYPVTSSASRAGVMIYAFDAAVAMSSKQPNIESYSLSSQIQDSARDYQHGMSLLAGETGGDIFFSLDGLSNHLPKMLGDNRVYYRLAYAPPTGKSPKKYRRISVSLKDHPEYQVRAQKGYILHN